MTSIDRKASMALSRPYPDRRIVWRVSYRKRSAEIYLGGPLPGWVHEHAQYCRWKIIKGEHLL